MVKCGKLRGKLRVLDFDDGCILYSFFFLNSLYFFV